MATAPIADGNRTVAEMCEEIFRLWLDVVSGRQSKSEAFGYGDNEFVPWQIGAVM
jgi:altronate hydrolase